jgi:hypothetical protein
MTESSITVPATGALEVAVVAGAEDPTAFQDKLRLESAAWNAEIPVEVAPIAAMVKFSGAVPDFGKVVAGELAEATAVLENSGGVPAAVMVRVDAPFELSAAGVEVPAQGKVSVPVRFRAAKGGSYSAVLVAETGGAMERLTLAVEAANAPETRTAPELRHAANGTASDAASEAATAPKESTRPAAGGRNSDFTGPVPPADAPTSMGRYTRDITAKSAVLEWPATLGPGASLAVQERQLSLGKDGALVIQWTPVAAVFSETADVRRAELKDLRPDQLYIVRVQSAGESVFTTKFVTPQKKPLIDIGWRSLFITAMVIGFGVVLWHRWKNRVRSGW